MTSSSPERCSVRRYTTAAKALSDASQNGATQVLDAIRYYFGFERKKEMNE